MSLDNEDTLQPTKTWYKSCTNNEPEKYKPETLCNMGKLQLVRRSSLHNLAGDVSVLVICMADSRHSKVSMKQFCASFEIEG